MYSDLFSSMDGARSILFWMFPTMVIMFLWSGFMFLSSGSSACWKHSFMMWSETSLLRFNFFQKSLGSMFLFLMLNNMLGLTPYTYTMTSNLGMMSFYAMIFWLGLLVSGYIGKTQEAIANLAPAGAPLVLLPFLVLIETVSIMIRPLTLTVRMVANISAGHIVLGLLANATTSLYCSLSFVVMILAVIAYTLFEFFVGAIQAYIFMLLIGLYSVEHPKM